MERNSSSLVKTSLPEKSPFGILSPATDVVEDTSGNWLGNFIYEVPDARVQSDNWLVIGGADRTGVTAVQSPNGMNYRSYFPFEVRASIEYSTMGLPHDEVLAQAKRALDVVTQKSIEFEFWNGDIAKKITDANDNRYLAHNTAVDVTPVPGTGVKLRYGQALLEGALGSATIGSAGVLHAPWEVASVMKLHHGGTGSQQFLETHIGNKVVAGSGYTKRGPGGVDAPAGMAWVYATGPVTVKLGEIQIVPEKLSQAVDSSINNIAYYADRPAAVTWSTSNLYAVLIDLTLDYA